MTDEPLFSLTRRWLTPCYNNLKKLEWVDGFTVRSHGVRIGIQVNDLALLPVLKERLPEHATQSRDPTVDVVLSVIAGGRKPGTRIRTFSMLYHNHSQMVREHRLERVLDGFDAILSLSVAQLAPRRVFIHAGVVEWRGQAVLLPGKSYAGKTTLVAELVRQGGRYYSDEFAILDEKGRVHPYPKPLSMRAEGGYDQTDIPASRFGASGHLPMPAGLVVMTRFKEGSKWRPRRLTAGEGMLGLLANCVPAQTAPERVMTYLRNFAQQAEFIKSPRGEATLAAGAILKRVDRSHFARQDVRLAR